MTTTHRSALARRVAAIARLRGAAGPLALAVTFGMHVATGFAAVAVHYGAMWAFMRAGLGPVAASAAGFAGGALTRFALSYAHVFVPTVGLARAGVRFAVAIALQLALNSLGLSALLALGVPVWPAQVAVTIGLTFLNFAIYRAWVFR
jgi:putative flippase GtrA